MSNIYEEIGAERERQREKWGDAHDDEHTVNDFIAITLMQMQTLPFAELEHRAWIRVAAVAVAAAERVERRCFGEVAAMKAKRLEASAPAYGRVCPHCGETVAMWHETWEGVTMEVTILTLDEHGTADETEQGSCDGGSPGNLCCQECGGEVSQEDWSELEVREIEGGEG